MPVKTRTRTPACASPPKPAYVQLVCQDGVLHDSVGATPASIVNALEECRDAAPALFAAPGDLFEHRLDERMQSFEPDCFEYLGRAKGVGVDEMWSMGEEKWSPRGAKRTPKGWLVFKHDGYGRHGVGGSYGAINGGMRDVIGAWPVFGYYLYDAKGNPVDEEHILCLPPSMCYCFRAMEFPDNDDE